MTLPFIKMHGLGNDYVFVDCFPQAVSRLISKTNIPALARRISDRHIGIGSDGLVLIQPSQEADAKMRIFNADGSEAQMCGNAIRCVGKYLYESGICVHTRLFIETLAGIRALTLDVSDGCVKEITVNMGTPRIQSDALMKGTDPIGFYMVDMGNPHAVFFRDVILSDAEMAEVGQRIGTHPHFVGGTNVEFVRVRNSNELDVRVWERGSGVTMACGTGACAATVAAIQNGWTKRVVTVHLPGGDLQVRWGHDTMPVYMIGSATEVFRGEYPLTNHE